jgi:hypothetical protein
MAMDDAICPECKKLQQAALVAIMRHDHAQDRLTGAKLRRDSLQIIVLEPEVEHLFRERSAAVRAYGEHLDTHTPQAQATSCQTRRELAEKFAIAARLYTEAVVKLIREPNTPSSQSYWQLCANLEEAERRSEAAGRALREHIDVHGCGG